MPPAKKRRVAAAQAAAEILESADFAMELKADDNGASSAPVVVAAPPPPSPSSTVVVAMLTSTSTPQPNHVVAAVQPDEIMHSSNNNNNNDYPQHGILTAKLFDLHRATLNTLRDNVAELATVMATASSARNNNNGVNDHTADPLYNELLLTSSLALSDLKSIQRRLSLQVEQHANIAKERRECVEHYSLLLENLMYERKYLQHEVMLLASWKPEELEQMARSELGISASGGSSSSSTSVVVGGGQQRRGGIISSSSSGGEAMEVENVSAEITPLKITTAEEAIDAYLFAATKSESDKSPASTSSSRHRDPSHRQFILQKIQSDLEARASLVEQLSKSKLELKELQKKRDTLRGFLNQVPKKVLELEKAGESLSAFFGSSNIWKDVLSSNEEKYNDNDTDEASMDVSVTDNDTIKSNEKKKVQAANLLVHRASCDRTKRFQMAQSNLPSPLYVLFVQLTGYIDAWATIDKLGGVKSNNVLDGFAGANGMKVTVAPNDNRGGDGYGGWNVVLTLFPADILPPEVSSILGKSYSSSRSANSKAAFKIVFTFNKGQGVVLAFVEGDGVTNGQFLDDLFPGDDGLSNPNIALSLLDEEGSDERRYDCTSAEGESKDEKKLSNCSTREWKLGKPYYWCQVLSGLTFPPPSSATNGMTDIGGPFPIQSCTKAVFRQLTRRVRACKTLASILEYLGKRNSLHPLPIPIHPAFKGDDCPTIQSQHTKVKLHSWTEDSKASDPSVAGTAQTSYTAIIKRKSSTLKATVLIDTQNYPAEPPVWSLQNEDASSGMSSSWAEEHGSMSSLQHSSDSITETSPPLFDAALNRIECHVNQNLDKFVNPNVESTFDWILIHQLSEIISCWDEVMVVSEGNVGSNNVSKTGTELGIIADQVRIRKGKDRRLLGFGERSPFFWYRRGL